MGNAAIKAREDATNQQATLNSEIKEFEEMTAQVMTRYNNPRYGAQLCDNLRWYYTDRLTRLFQPVELRDDKGRYNNVKARLGLDVERLGDIDLTPEAKAYKQEVCEQVKGFYKAKIEVIGEIRDVLVGCNQKTNSLVESWNEGKFQNVTKKDKIRYQQATNAYNTLRDFQDYIGSQQQTLKSYMTRIAASRYGPEQKELIQEVQLIIGQVDGKCKSYSTRLTEWKEYVTPAGTRPGSPASSPRGSPRTSPTPRPTRGAQPTRPARVTRPAIRGESPRRVPRPTTRDAELARLRADRLAQEVRFQQ